VPPTEMVPIAQCPDDFGTAYAKYVVMFRFDIDKVGVKWCLATLGQPLKTSSLGKHVYKLYFWHYGTKNKEVADGVPLYRPCNLPKEKHSTAADAPLGSWYLVQPQDE
jgi:hypothetical protein